ncbi:hypothetical protein KC19_1G317700 [Ceratodon purpureus]|uniref:SWIM-type domain-containing protein n=1 Tax=Ceratodon purpureus TaxID=3225 RepID=A0A8T0JD40_CERPU|nr:hypothetical protein KC19_1G317700 [Ceratodon purpureus]
MRAYIPFDRVGDFLRGQTCEGGIEVGWNVAERIQGIHVLRPQVDSYIEHVYYECPFGPKDLRGDPTHPHSKKRGCLARFSIKQLLLRPDVAEVAYYQVDHNREDGTPAHGLEDKDFIGRKSAYQPRMSLELKKWIKTRLSEGFTAKQVYEEHRRNLIERRKEHPENVFMWHEKDDVTDLPFILGIQTPWQKEMLKYGHNGAIAMDATFGTNVPKYPLYSLLVFDHWRNGIPVAWVLSSRSSEEDLVMWLEPLRRNLEGTRLDFLPSCFIVDDAVEQRNALKRAWPESEVLIYLCAFHVLKNWKNHIWTKVPNLGSLREFVYRQLHSLLYMPIEYQETEEDFLKQMYLIGHRRNPHSNQDTQASIESYHAALKRWMKIDNHQLRGRRMDSLVWRLTNPIETHYMYNDGRKSNGFVLNKHVEKIVASGIAKAKAIPIEHVRRHHAIEGLWQVHSQSALGRWYDIMDPYIKYASCSCEWAIRRNMCKHQLVIIKCSTDIS